MEIANKILSEITVHMKYADIARKAEEKTGQDGYQKQGDALKISQFKRSITGHMNMYI